jgi:hypothetical protein
MSSKNNPTRRYNLPFTDDSFEKKVVYQIRGTAKKLFTIAEQDQELIGAACAVDAKSVDE